MLYHADRGSSGNGQSVNERRLNRTDSAEDVIVVRQMGLAVLAAIDARRVQVYVVRKTHGEGRDVLRRDLRTLAKSMKDK